jgi:hypothetical protein
VDPEPLVRVLPDRVFDDAREALGVFEHVLFSVSRPGQGDLFAENEPVFPVFEAGHVSRKDGSLRMKGKQGKAVGRAGGAAEKVDEDSFLPGHVLIQEKTDDAVLLQDPQHGPHGPVLVLEDVARAGADLDTRISRVGLSMSR